MVNISRVPVIKFRKDRSKILFDPLSVFNYLTIVNIIKKWRITDENLHFFWEVLI